MAGNADPERARAAGAADDATVAGLSCLYHEVPTWNDGVRTGGPDIDTNSGGTVTPLGSRAEGERYVLRL